MVITESQRFYDQNGLNDYDDLSGDNDLNYLILIKESASERTYLIRSG